jgi:hypothetical protein
MRARVETVSLLIALLIALASALPLRAQAPAFELGIYEGVPWPIIPAPVWPPPRMPQFPATPAPAASPAGTRIAALMQELRTSIRQTRYQHQTVIRERDGLYLWDCSAMAAWVLRRSAPRAMQQLTRSRPVARDFVSAIEHAPTDHFARGWQRIERLEDARPGDLFAWRRPRGFPSRNTGHVGFLVDQPLAVPGLQGMAVRIADATSVGHQADTREGDEEGGFGIGTLVFLTDEEGRGTHYGWAGTASDGYVTTPIFIGRVSQ